MNRFGKSVAALGAGWLAAGVTLYTPVYIATLLPGSVLKPNLEAAVFLGSLVLGAAINPVTGCRVADLVAARLGTVRAPSPRPGWGRQLAAYGAGIGMAIFVSAAAVLPFVVATKRNWGGPGWILSIWVMAMVPAMPFFSVLATRAVLRGGRGSAPAAPGATAGEAAPAPRTTEDPPVLRIAPAPGCA